jgi:endonuclease-3 related protein
MMDEGHKRDVTTNTVIVHPTILLDGRIQAKWKKNGEKLTVTPFCKISSKNQKQIAQYGKELFQGKVREVDFQWLRGRCDGKTVNPDPFRKPKRFADLMTLTAIYDALLARYGNPRWWPAKTPYEVIVGAVLTQNTAWGNVEKAIANFAGDLSPERVMALDMDALAGVIRPAGFFNQKAAYLKRVTAWFGRYDFDVSAVRKLPLTQVRAELLSVRGVGNETADSILLYAFSFPSFVVDAYTIRLSSRLPIDAGGSYEKVKAYFENNLPRDVEIYNNFHALIVVNAKEYCRKKPVCEVCPLSRLNCREAGLVAER